jgi:hypothetical protein
LRAEVTAEAQHGHACAPHEEANDAIPDLHTWNDGVGLRNETIDVAQCGSGDYHFEVVVRRAHPVPEGTLELELLLTCPQYLT